METTSWRAQRLRSVGCIGGCRFEAGAHATCQDSECRNCGSLCVSVAVEAADRGYQSSDTREYVLQPDSGYLTA